MPAFLENGVAFHQELPAAAYYQWAGQISDAERRGELERLESRTDDNLVAVVQRAILHYHLGTEGGSIDTINLNHPRMPGCSTSESCVDYQAFVELFRELQRTEELLAESIDRNEVLEDRIRNLNQQIEALTNIEQQLLEREQRPN
ncbi:MAG: hypothetical protein MRY76_11480 [Pseudomonadales bacterium]|nr:hypothetical protein [Pseudomonadales bacterium]